MTRADELSTARQPWYRQTWPWLLMLGPFVVVVAAFVTLWLAIRSNDGLVADDYYKQGLAINQTLARTERARDLQLGARVVMSGSDLALTLTAREGVSLPSALRLTFSHPTRSGMDRVVELKQVFAGRYQGAMPMMSAGHWLVLLEDTNRTWRLSGAGRLPDQREIDLGAADSQHLE
jgi:uncharacterized protein